MGFFKWIKRELDAPGSCKRRQSEPPISFGALNSETTRDESYVRAIFKFNEWRSRNRFGSFRSVNRKSSKRTINKVMSKPEDNRAMKSENVLNPYSNSNNLEVHNNGVYEEICVGADINIRKALQNEVNIRRSSRLTSTSKKHPSDHLQHNISVSKMQLQKDYSNDNEIYQFENNHCVQHKQRNFECTSTEKIQSPPKPFYKENSHPFLNVQSPHKSHSRHSLTSRPRHNDICKRNKQNSKSYNDHNHLPDVLSNHERFQNERSSPYYQMIINSKGEEVEYAIPFCEKSSIYSNYNCCKERNEFDSVPEQTGGRQEPSETIEGGMTTLHSQSLPNSQSLDFNNRRNVIITDLDKSAGTVCNSPVTSKCEIFKELNSLEMWSKNISLDEEQDSTNCSVNEILGSSSTIMCHGRDSANNGTPFKGNLNLPVFINLENFRKMPVSKFHIRHPDKFVVEKALQHNFLIMRKIRHPCISLLMASTINVNRRLASLILEPFKGTLNQIIYESNKQIALEDCIDYAIQISKAAVYLQENGLVHSNICSHAICVCENDKQVKLSSFHLTTFLKTQIKEEILTLYSGLLISEKLSKVSGKHLPYFVEYRKIFSHHFYQSPELISTQKSFVFPCKQSDVYGITLTLWEMLNCKTPFAMFNYFEMEKIFSLRQAQLQNFEAERCEKFESVLDLGLRINPNERIKDVNELCIQLEELKKSLALKSEKRIPNNEQTTSFAVDKTDQMSLPFSRFPNPSGVTTSTVKKKKENSSIHRVASKEPFQNLEERRSNVHAVLQNTFQQKLLDKSEFEIDEFSLPNTPIARNNKIRKTVWLTNKSMSPITPLNCNYKIIQNGSTHTPISSLKKYNVNITIIQNEVNNEMTPNQLQNPSIQSQIKYWNSLSSPSEENIKEPHEDNSYKHTEEQTCKPRKLEISEDKNSFTEDVALKKTKTEIVIGREIGDKEVTTKKNYYPSMPELLSEAFRRKNRSADDEFEQVFWRREKEICELSSPPRDKEENGVITPKRTTVREAVSKFEKISTEADNSGAAQNAQENDNPANIYSKNSFIGALERRYKLQREGLPRSEVQIMCNQEPITRTDALGICNENIPSYKTQIDDNLTVELGSTRNTLKEDYKNKCHMDKIKFNEEIEVERETNISKLDVLLRYDENGDEKRKSHSNPELNKSLTKDEDVEDNVWKKSKFKNLIRRSSDVGYSPHKVASASGQFAAFRHSFGGTDFRNGNKKLRLFNGTINLEGLTSKVPENKTLLSSLIANNQKLYPKIKCQDCGSHNIYISGRISRHIELFSAQLPSLSNRGQEDNTYSIRNSTSPVKASIEDLYIDDDLKYQSSDLGPNLKLNISPETPESPVNMDFDPDILNMSILSSEYFKSNELS